MRPINLLSREHFIDPYSFLNSKRENQQIGKYLGYKVFFSFSDVNQILLSTNIGNNNDIVPKCPYSKKITESFPMSFYSKEKHLEVKKKQIKAIYKDLDYEGLAHTAYEKTLQFTQGQGLNIQITDFTKVLSFYLSTRIIGLNLSKDLIDFYDAEAVESIGNLISKNFFSNNDNYSAIHELELNFNKSEVYNVFINDANLSKEINIDSLFTFLTFGSYATSKATFTFIIKYLLDHQEVVDFIKNCDDKRIHLHLANEFIRLSSPIKFVERKAIDNFVLRDTKIKKNDSLLLCLASANRDPLAFENPNRINLNKVKNSHVAFTKGQFFCLGADIALNSTAILLKKIVTIIDTFKNKELTYKKNPFLILN